MTDFFPQNNLAMQRASMALLVKPKCKRKKKKAIHGNKA